MLHQSLIMRTLRRELRGIAIALLMVLAMTIVAYVLNHYLEIRRGSVIYLIPVLLAGWHLGLVPALVAAVAGVLWSGYFFYPPSYLEWIGRPHEILNIALFTVVAVVTSHLAGSMKRQHEVVRRREKEMSDLYAFSRRLATASSAAEISRAIEEHLTKLVQRRVVLIGTGDKGSDPGPDDAALPDRVRAAVKTAQEGATAAMTAADRTGNLWLVRRLSQRTPDFGVIAIDLGETSNATAELRARIDEALFDAAATLERLDVARALNEAKMRSETELLREALIGSVSHELRTPLASILGAATVLSDAPTITKDARLSSLLAVVRDEAERLNSEIQKLLDATRISREQIKTRPEWVEPADIVNSALERCQRRLASHKLVLDLDSNLPFIYVDPVLIEQAFVQIVDNAAKYSPLGSLISVAAKRSGEDVILSVKDAGVGLTPEEMAQVGERFFRGPRHAATVSGSGLGLWIAKAFVGANGGRITAVSGGPGQGATISILLPHTAQASRPEALVDD